MALAIINLLDVPVSFDDCVYVLQRHFAIGLLPLHLHHHHVSQQIERSTNVPVPRGGLRVAPCQGCRGRQQHQD